MNRLGLASAVLVRLLPGLFAGLLSGCYNPTIPSGAQQCGPGGACSPGMECGPDNRCYKAGEVPMIMPDLTRPPVDLTVGDTAVADPPDLAVPLPDLSGCGGACMAPTPVCDPDTNKCVPCTLASDVCTGGTVCSKAMDGTFSCVAGCKQDNECMAMAPDGGAPDGGVMPKLACCNKKCVDVNSDGANCGKCGTACNAQACCSGACVDTTKDVANCGNCGRACVGYKATWSCGVPMGGMAPTCQVATCIGSFQDCNKDPTDGCGANTTSDAKNCAKCGTACDFANAVGKCAGACFIDACNDGFKNCNNDVKDGCEVDINTSPMNCGLCGKVCALPPNATGASCKAAQCGIAACRAGFEDCDNNPINGCETVTTTDVNNCGKCANKCPAVPNGQPTCAMGLCGGGACMPGFGDCNGNPNDGCETKISSDIKNCGTCAKVCPNVPNGVGGCNVGNCVVLSCNPNFSDCNKVVADGCEANFLSDAKNCGACGKVCANGCSNGQCVVLAMFPGIRMNVPINTLTGWTECFSTGYQAAGTPIATVQTRCPGSNILIGCRQANSTMLTLAAHAPRADVFFDTGGGKCDEAQLPAPHVANGVAWYFNTGWSWGFFRPGDGVNRCSCDTAPASPELRMCWHTAGGNLAAGYRCGSAYPGDNNTERVVFTSN